jgi:hypothetical protein
MQNSHFLLDKHIKPIFHKNFDVFFSTFLYIHVGNMLLVDDTPYKNMFNIPYNAIFLESFMTMGRINIFWVQFSLIWKIFIRPDIVFPLLLKTIPLVGLNLLI